MAGLALSHRCLTLRHEHLTSLLDERGAWARRAAGLREPGGLAALGRALGLQARWTQCGVAMKKMGARQLGCKCPEREQLGRSPAAALLPLAAQF